MKTREEIEAMSVEERCVKTAEICGWELSKIKGEFRYVSIDPQNEDRVFHSNFGEVSHFPDYLNSLDAMAEAEKMFGEIDIPDCRLTYAYALQEVLGLGSMTTRFDFITATAAQRNCAFLMLVL